MTDRQRDLVHNLREKLFRNNYPLIFVVDNETLEAVEQDITEWLESRGESPILKCGRHGLFFKGCELVLEVK